MSRTCRNNFDKKTFCQYWVFCLDRSSTGEVNFVKYKFRIDIRFSVLICAPFQYWYSCGLHGWKTGNKYVHIIYFQLYIFSWKIQAWKQSAFICQSFETFQFVIKLLFDYLLFRNEYINEFSPFRFWWLPEETNTGAKWKEFLVQRLLGGFVWLRRGSKILWNQVRQSWNPFPKATEKALQP